MAINFFNSEKILRLTPLAKDTETVADNILAGDVRVFPKLPNVRVGSLEELWEMQFESAPSTYALYVYALYPVSYLLNAYEATGRSSYLKNALTLAMSFLDWELASGKGINKRRNKILFGDHAVSNRTQVLCYLVCCLKEEGHEINGDIEAALLRNGEYLANIDNYSHYNHGLMMDLALLGLVNTLAVFWFDYPRHLKTSLLNRLQHSIVRDLTEDGVHIENSPGYHFWMLGFLGRITPALQVFDKHLYLKAQGMLRKATEYAEYITRPDGSVPAVGDTHASVTYKSRKGLESKFFPHANQVVFRSSKDDIWAHFSCGYKTHVHKHHDNGSFILFYNGKDIFIDPGFLTYENEIDAVKIKGSSFHNTAVPIGKDQVIVAANLFVDKQSYDKNLSGSRIIGYVRDLEIEYTLGVVADYPNVEVERLIVWIKPNVFLVFDSTTPFDEGFDQIFHIPPDLTPIVSQEGIVLYSIDCEPIAKVLQYSGGKCKFDPSIASLLPAFYASDFGVKADSSRLVFRCLKACSLAVAEVFAADEHSFVIDSFDGVVVKYRRNGDERVLDFSSLKKELYSKGDDAG